MERIGIVTDFVGVGKVEVVEVLWLARLRTSGRTAGNGGGTRRRCVGNGGGNGGWRRVRHQA